MNDSLPIEYYEGRHDEAERLRVGHGRLEFARTVELLGRHLPEPPARVVDVGGGTGVYSARLASCGFDLELVEPVPAHVAAASAAGGFVAKQGDARSLEAADDS